MTSPATQEPCQKCKDEGVVVDAAGRIIPCDCIWGTSPAPPSQRAELLTQEQLGAAIFNAYRPVTAKVDHGATIDKLVGHITALTQRVEAADKLAREVAKASNLCSSNGGCCFKRGSDQALANYRALSQEPRNG